MSSLWFGWVEKNYLFLFEWKKNLSLCARYTVILTSALSSISCSRCCTPLMLAFCIGFFHFFSFKFTRSLQVAQFQRHIWILIKFVFVFSHKTKNALVSDVSSKHELERLAFKLKCYARTLASSIALHRTKLALCLKAHYFSPTSTAGAC